MKRKKQNPFFPTVFSADHTFTLISDGMPLCWLEFKLEKGKRGPDGVDGGPVFWKHLMQPSKFLSVACQMKTESNEWHSISNQLKRGGFYATGSFKI